jgi:hypothetical protein
MKNQSLNKTSSFFLWKGQANPGSGVVSMKGDFTCVSSWPLMPTPLPSDGPSNPTAVFQKLL